MGTRLTFLLNDDDSSLPLMNLSNLKLLDLYNSLSLLLLQNFFVIARDLQDLQSLTDSQSILNKPRVFLVSCDGARRDLLRRLRLTFVLFSTAFVPSVSVFFDSPTRLSTLSITAANRTLILFTLTSLSAFCNCYSGRIVRSQVSVWISSLSNIPVQWRRDAPNARANHENPKTLWQLLAHGEKELLKVFEHKNCIQIHPRD